MISDTNWTFIESLVFGALISSTDPVTVLSLLPSNVDKRLYMLIFGESALNDAVAIILYRFFTGLQGESGDLGPLPFLVSVLASFGVFLGSFCVGVVMAMIFAKITKHVWIEGYEGAIYEMVMLFVFAYSSYLLAEILSLTGIISIFFCGIAMAHYAYSNLTELTRRTMKVNCGKSCYFLWRTQLFFFCQYCVGDYSHDQLDVRGIHLFVSWSWIAVFWNILQFLVCNMRNGKDFFK